MHVRSFPSRRTGERDRHIEPASAFYEVEDHHQQYLEKRGRATCTVELAADAAGTGAA